MLDSYNYSIGVRTLKYDTKGLHINGESVKVRGFCDHSNFAGVGGAVPDRVNLYRTQMLRSVGGNAWRMAHNPPIPSRLDFADRLGMLILDENRAPLGRPGQNSRKLQISFQKLQEKLQKVQKLQKKSRKSRKSG